jgi:hypothetical protein
MTKKYHLLLLIFALLIPPVSATSGFTVEHDHNLNILGGDDGTIVVQSSIIDQLDLELPKVTHMIQSMTQKYGVWIESKSKTGKLRFKLSKTDNKNRLKIEYDRTQALADGRIIKFSGITYIDISEG